MSWSLVLIKLQRLRSATLFKGTPTQVFSGEICEIFKNIYFEEYLRTTAYRTLPHLISIRDLHLFQNSCFQM